MPNAALSAIASFALIAISAALAVVITGCGVLALARYRALPPLLRWQPGTTGRPPAGAPTVSIIVPTRNDEHRLPRLLRSLIALDYPLYEVIVADDASTDATPAVAARYSADTEGLVRALDLSVPEAGWTSRSWACWQGARAARGEWLLFTDAGTEHEYGSLRAVVAAVREAKVAALALLPRQQCRGFWERLLLPFAYQQYFAALPPACMRLPDDLREAADASTPTPTGIGRLPDAPTSAPDPPAQAGERRGPAPELPWLANGQYFLIRREIYAAFGGHAAVAGSANGDAALAVALARAGYAVLACHGEELVRARAYAGLGALVAGVRRNALQLPRTRRAAGALVVAGVAGPVLALGVVAAALLTRSPVALGAGLLAYAVQVLLLLPWERACGVRWGYALLAPLAALLLALIALSGLPRMVAGRSVNGKDESHSGGKPARRAAEREAVRRG